MKKVVFLLVALLIFIGLSGCVNNPITMQAKMDVINKNGGKVYVYKELCGDLDSIKNVEVFTEIGSMVFDSNYTMIVIDCGEYYDDITKIFIGAIFDILDGSTSKIAVGFFDSKDYNYFEWTELYSEKSWYPRNNEYVKTLDNFGDKLNVMNYGVIFGTDNAPLGYQVINAFDDLISDYIRNQ